MATILRGKDKGKAVTIKQFCNDWFTIQESSRVYSAVALQFDISEIDMILKETLNGNVGIMFGLYNLEEFMLTGIFRRNKLDKTYKNKV